MPSAQRPRVRRKRRWSQGPRRRPGLIQCFPLIKTQSRGLASEPRARAAADVHRRKLDMAPIAKARAGRCVHPDGEWLGKGDARVEQSASATSCTHGQIRQLADRASSVNSAVYWLTRNGTDPFPGRRCVSQRHRAPFQNAENSFPRVVRPKSTACFRGVTSRMVWATNREKR